MILLWGRFLRTKRDKQMGTVLQITKYDEITINGDINMGTGLKN